MQEISSNFLNSRAGLKKKNSKKNETVGSKRKFGVGIEQQDAVFIFSFDVEDLFAHRELDIKGSELIEFQ